MPSQSLGSKLSHKLAEKAVKLAGGDTLPKSKYMPGVARQVAASGGGILYSRAADIASALPQESGTVEQMIGMLKKRGASAKELENADVPSEGKVTRGQLADHFLSRQPEVKHIVIPDGRYSDRVAPDDHENYREHLLQLQDPELSKKTAALQKRREAAVEQIRSGIRTGDASAEQLGRDAHKSIQDEISNLSIGAKPKYKSGHFDQPDILAHFRTTDRGNTMNVEEVQSDWGQDKRVGAPVSDHPYVSSTGNWTDLALKHVFHEAVKGGYDHVSFNPGAVNAEVMGVDSPDGMKTFYDKIIPQAALKLARQHDPDIQPGVGPTGGFSLPITDDLKQGVSQKGFPAFASGGKVREDKHIPGVKVSLKDLVAENGDKVLHVEKIEKAMPARSSHWDKGMTPSDIGAMQSARGSNGVVDRALGVVKGDK